MSDAIELGYSEKNNSKISASIDGARIMDNDR